MNVRTVPTNASAQSSSTAISELLGNSFGGLSIAVIIPCYNEAIAIGKVVQDFKEALPSADIYVYDNNSSDDTRAVAETAGAIVRSETRQGKGFVVRRMFADIEADIFVMVDGDDTYDASAAPMLVEKLVLEGLDMVNGARKPDSNEAYRPGHAMGNKGLSGIVRFMFGDEFKDMLSGYRVFSRRYVKSFPAMSTGFETETELTIHALELEMPIAEVETDFKDRAEGSESKLRTFSDGFRILWTIASLLKQEKPVYVFGLASALMALASVGLAYPIVAEFIETGLVPRFPTAILSTGLMILSFLSLTCGIILDAVTRSRAESKRSRYLMIPSVHHRLSEVQYALQRVVSFAERG